jgi:hypothetical protein
MSRKSLFFGSIVLILAMLFTLAGCNNPAGGVGPEGPQGPSGPASTQPGPQGPVGPTGPGIQSLTANPVDEALLSFYFDYKDFEGIVLEPGVTTVSGTVPAGKTLYVVVGAAGVVTVDSAGLILEDGATLEIWSGALTATGLGTVGVLKPADSAAAPVIKGAGTLFLPIIVDDVTYDAGYHAESPEVSGVTGVYPGSAVTNNGPNSTPVVEAFTNSNIARYFTNKASTLTVLNVSEPITDVAFLPAPPKAVSLTLKGTANSIAAAFALPSNTKLIVDTNAELDIQAAFSANADAEFTNKGLVTLTGSGSGLINNSAGGTITNNGTIEETDTDLAIANVEVLLGLPGSGTIVLEEPSGAVTLTLTGVDNPLFQNVVIQSGVTLSGPNGLTDIFSSVAEVGKKITIESGGVLSLDDDNTKIGAAVDNKTGGTITTATDNASVLTTIFTSSGNKGAVTATALTTIDAALIIPQDITLTVGGTTDFSNGSNNVTVNGELVVDNVDLTPDENIFVNGRLTINNSGTGSLAMASGKTLNIASTAILAGVGTINTVTSGGDIKIEGKEGSYTADDLAAEDYADALEDVTEAIGLLKNKYDLDGPGSVASLAAFGGSVIGTIDFFQPTGTGAAQDVAANHTTASIPPIKLPVGTGVESVSVDVAKGASSSILDSDFSLDVSTGVDPEYDTLTLEDTAYNGGTPEFCVLQIKEYKVSNANLISPLQTAEPFRIGIKTER